MARGKKKEEINKKNPLHNEEEKEMQIDTGNKNTEIKDEEEVQTQENIVAEESLDTEEDSGEKRWLERILTHPIKVLEKSGETETYVIKTVGEVIDTEQDIWYSPKKKKPIISDPGTKKLIEATGATFPKIIVIEKQSDATSRDREQVWIEATVLFPDGTTNEDYGIANRMNCPDPISGANLPIMARKRGMHRAFYRSGYIGLYELNDENEVLEARGEKEERQYKLLQEKLKQQELKNKKLVNQMCKEIKSPDGELVWKINDQSKLTQLAKGTSLVSYLALLKLRHLSKKEKANS
ncbi:hypothetical protein [Priestia aryabhattai]